MRRRRRWWITWWRSGGKRRRSRRGVSVVDVDAEALGGEDVAPSLDELSVGLGDGAGVAIEVVQAAGVDGVVVLAEGGVPVHLIGEAVPGEADDGDAVALEGVHVDPFFFEPGGGTIG